MELGGRNTLENGLEVSVDWLSFTFLDSKSPECALELLGYDKEEFRLRSCGRFGYRKSMEHIMHSIFISFDGSEDMGVHVDISGSGIHDVLEHYYKGRMTSTVFGEAYEVESFDSVIMNDFLKDIQAIGQVTRLDLAADDFGANYFNVPELIDLFTAGRYVSKFRKWRQETERNSHAEITGNTIYFGKRVSECMLRVYDKQLEQNAKLEKKEEPLIETAWVRWELELKGSYAERAVRFLINGMQLGELITGVLSNYLRLIEDDNVRKYRCSTTQKWLDFIAGVSQCRLYQKPEPKTIDDSLEWLRRQVSPTLAAVCLAFDGDMEFIYQLLDLGKLRFSRRHMDMIRAYGGNLYDFAECA